MSGEMCRLCNASLRDEFELRVCARFLVEYYVCEGCGSLQTERPYWLELAYQSGNISALDTGAAQRVLVNAHAVRVASSILGIRNVVDIGGGDGLLTRLLRDGGINCFVRDKYARPTYAQGFSEPDFSVPDLVTAFEVIEHYANPADDFEELFGGGAKVVMVTTEIYSGQDGGWWYLAPETGQHVFFYSRRALEDLARRFGYRLVLCGGYILFLKDVSVARLLALKMAFRPWVSRLVHCYFRNSGSPGVWRDHEHLRGKLNGPEKTLGK